MFRVIAVLLAMIFAGSACSGPDASSDQEPVTPTAPPSATTSPGPLREMTPTPMGVMPTPTASVSPTASATRSPELTATATLTPTVLPTPLPPTPTAVPLRASPESQAIALPNVNAQYQLAISELDVDSGYLRASEIVTISALEGVPSPLFLQVVPAWDGFFTLLEMTVDDVVVEPSVLHGGFTLAVPLQVGAPEAVIAMDFELRVGAEASGWGGTSLDGSVLRLGYWFPIVSTDHGYSDTLDPSYTDVASFDVSLTVDPDVAFSYTGEIVEEAALDDGRVRYVMRADNVRDFALALSRDYTRDRVVSEAGVAVELYSIDTASETRSAVLAWAVDAIDQLSALIGPYPYATFRIADAGPSMPGGVEFPGMVYYNPNYAQLDRLIYHEVAHQWLYGIIGTRTLDDGWVDEGGAEFFERGLPTGFAEVPTVPPGGYEYPLDAASGELLADASRQWYFSIYEQGARLYYAVAETMGWEAFWQAMRALYDTYAFGIATSWDVLETWQLHSPVDLRPLFDETFRYDWIDQLPEPGG